MTFISKTLRVVGQITTGAASEELKQLRGMICSSCPVLEYDIKTGYTCGKYLNPQEGVSCGCVIADKIAVEGEACPQGFW